MMPPRPNSGEPEQARRGEPRVCPSCSVWLPRIGAGGLIFLLSLSGCALRTASTFHPPAVPADAGDTLAPGVVHRAIPTQLGAGIDLVDIDFAQSHCRLTIQTHGIALSGGHAVGQAFTPHEWLTHTHALMAVNGGYFGAEDGAGRKEFVGLLVQRGRVRHAAPPLVGSGSATIRRGRYVRSAFGLMPDGTPGIVWAATKPDQPQALRAYAGPMRSESLPWGVDAAVGCGPTLISGGKLVVTQYQERLVSPGPEPRTFVAYDRVNGQPRHLVIGIASGSDFAALAAFLSRYFPRYDHSRAECAMCLDGGASTQMTYTLNGTALSPRETGVTVPDALVLLPK